LEVVFSFAVIHLAGNYLNQPLVQWTDAVYLSFVIKYITPVFIAAVFLASLPGIWEKITAKGLPWQVHGARALLLTMFLTICWFVRVAYLKRVANLKSPKA
ncbi:MAG: hypothetical protein ACK6A5_00570, partial [Flavobacteriales bacterium]